MGNSQIGRSMVSVLYGGRDRQRQQLVPLDHQLGSAHSANISGGSKHIRDTAGSLHPEAPLIALALKVQFWRGACRVSGSPEVATREAPFPTTLRTIWGSFH